jgi:hypothetical protein
MVHQFEDGTETWGTAPAGPACQTTILAQMEHNRRPSTLPFLSGVRALGVGDA